MSVSHTSTPVEAPGDQSLEAPMRHPGVPSDEFVSTPVETTAVSPRDDAERRRKLAKTVEFILNAYSDRPPPLTLAEQNLALKKVQRRAFLTVSTTGPRDWSLAEDAVTAMLLDLAKSGTLDRYIPSRATPRTFLNKILARHVYRERRRRWVGGGASLPYDVSTPKAGPAERASVNELKCVFDDLLTVPRAQAGRVAEPASADQCHARKSRRLTREWELIAPHMPGMSRRPKPRRAG